MKAKIVKVVICVLLLLVVTTQSTEAAAVNKGQKCPCNGGWQIEYNNAGIPCFYNCHCLNPYFYQVTGTVPKLPIEQTPMIDWQCDNLENCVLPELPVAQ